MVRSKQHPESCAVGEMTMGVEANCASEIQINVCTENIERTSNYTAARSGGAFQALRFAEATSSCLGIFSIHLHSSSAQAPGGREHKASTVPSGGSGAVNDRCRRQIIKAGSGGSTILRGTGRVMCFDLS
ncbi:hypothetical protein EVAR_3829_1 [Eumeta japonica]|uniref:Uncharacterized protein n=1 Tax=Eumeta variegata TaxID=151549 RepID=A0A4C1SQL9_EUMVA|nr:hypothetical protein EVAR_3829_1 [Eumeta japonica]